MAGIDTYIIAGLGGRVTFRPVADQGKCFISAETPDYDSIQVEVDFGDVVKLLWIFSDLKNELDDK